MKITLCGSTRFKDEFEYVNERLTLAGHVVYSVAFFGHKRETPLDPWEKQRLDLVHLAKILASDAILIVGSVDGKTPYIGESTRRERWWALINDKSVFTTTSSDGHDDGDLWWLTDAALEDAKLPVVEQTL